MQNWQKIFIRSAGFGSGFAVIVVSFIVIWMYYTSLPKKPKPWDDTAIVTTYSQLSATTGDRLGLSFRYLVENRTPYDYNLPNDLATAFIKLPESKGLIKDHEIVWDKGTYIPTGQKVAIHFNLTYDYHDYSFPKKDKDNLNKLSEFMNRRLKEIDGFVILDNGKRYKIIFPKSWEEIKSGKTEEE